MSIKLIVGLSNIGTKYTGTRHNAGAWYVNFIKDKLCSSFYEEPRFHGIVSRVRLIGMSDSIHLLIPTTSMNLSGKAIEAIASFYHIRPNEILVAHDELGLPPGVAKFKFGGNYNGHKGLEDIIRKLNNNRDFYRLRIGIGHPGNKNKVVNFVLDRPTVFEKNLINKVIEEAVCCTEIWLREGLVKAINRLHSFKV